MIGESSCILVCIFFVFKLNIITIEYRGFNADLNTIGGTRL